MVKPTSLSLKVEDANHDTTNREASIPQNKKIYYCDSVGRAVAYNIRGPQFESSDWQSLYWTFVYSEL